jgi:hypothetical protein
VSGRRRIAILAVCAVLAVLVAGYAAWQSGSPTPGPPVGSVRLGPEPGEEVTAYLARLPATLPPAGVVAPALVQFGAEPTVAAALAATTETPVGAVEPVSAVFRVALPRVQTALRFEPLEPGVAVPTAVDSARQRAAAAAAADAGRLTGRPREVAAAEAAALASPACACVLALVVQADGAALAALAARSGVRAVEAAPAGTTLPEIALSPLLPEQTVRADPLPDDGAVPSS